MNKIEIGVEFVFLFCMALLATVIISVAYMDYNRDLQYIKAGYSHCFEPGRGIMWKKGSCD